MWVRRQLSVLRCFILACSMGSGALVRLLEQGLAGCLTPLHVSLAVACPVSSRGRPPPSVRRQGPSSSSHRAPLFTHTSPPPAPTRLTHKKMLLRAAEIEEPPGSPHPCPRSAALPGGLSRGSATQVRCTGGFHRGQRLACCASGCAAVAAWL